MKSIFQGNKPQGKLPPQKAQEGRLNSDLNELRALEEKLRGSLNSPRDESLQLSQRNQCLLSLSKLLTGNGTCCALYETQDRELLISDNTDDARHVNVVMAVLGQLRSNPENDQVLASQLVSLVVGSPAYNPTSRTSDRQAASAKSTRVKLSAASSSLAHASPPSGIPLLAEQMQQLNKDIQCVIDGFRAGGACEDLSSYSFVQGDPGVHAEIKLIPYVIEDTLNKPEREQYIITSKLLCGTCDLIVKNVKDVYGVGINTTGMYGKSYTKWYIPSGMPKSISRSLERAVQYQLNLLRDINDGKSTTDSIHNLVSDEPEYLKHRSQGSAKHGQSAAAASAVDDVPETRMKSDVSQVEEPKFESSKSNKWSLSPRLPTVSLPPAAPRQSVVVKDQSLSQSAPDILETVSPNDNTISSASSTTVTKEPISLPSHSAWSKPPKVAQLSADSANLAAAGAPLQQLQRSAQAASNASTRNLQQPKPPPPLLPQTPPPPQDLRDDIANPMASFDPGRMMSLSKASENNSLTPPSSPKGRNLQNQLQRRGSAPSF